MKIERLELQNFRNYKKESIEFSKNFNIIYGENAQGKTNIIEAVFLCASGRSHRTSKDVELIKFHNEGYCVKVDIENNDAKKKIEIEYKIGKKKAIRINEIAVKKIGGLMGNLLAVIFSPEDLMVIKEGPTLRRRFIDITISQIKPTYFYDLQQYNKILLQRNALLKEIPKNRSLIETLDVWDENIAKVAARIIRVRFEFIMRLGRIAKEKHFKLTNEKENMIIEYKTSLDVIDKDESEIEKDLAKYLEKNRNIDLKRCTTSIGPHRDDYEIVIDGMNIKMFGSQGQQRTSILSIKLSEIEIIKEETGEYPVLLLDDVMSELDQKRQEYLIDNIDEIQTFITCTEANILNNKSEKEFKYIKVEEGRII